MNKAHWIFCLLLFSITFQNINAQVERSAQRVSAGIVNGKAISLPKPEYPAEAGKAGLTGTVNVKVTIDESGAVVAAQTISGVENAALRKAAEEAAMKAEFPPTILSGSPVKVTGIIVYNFVNDKLNEEKVKVLGVTTFLYLLRYSATDLQNFNKSFGPGNVIAETIDEFSEYKAELTPLLSLEKISSEKRVEKVDEVIKAFALRLNDSEKWQFEVGKDFVNVLQPFLVALASDGNFDITKFNETMVKENLLKIKKLTAEPPADFPKDILQKLDALADFGSKSQILSPENFKDLQKRMEDLFETISPGSTSN